MYINILGTTLLAHPSHPHSLLCYNQHLALGVIHKLKFIRGHILRTDSLNNRSVWVFVQKQTS